MRTYSVIILADTLERATALRSMKLDLHERAARRRPDSGDIAVPAILNEEQIRQLRAAGYRVEIVQDLEQEAAERSAEVKTGINRFRPGARDRAAGREAGEEEEQSGARRTLDELMDLSDLGESTALREARSVLGGYLTSDEVESALHTLAASYPDTVSVSALPEKSWEGRSSHVLRLRAGNETSRTGVLITGSMHAREWGGSDICVAFATNLLKSYKTGGSLKYGNKTFTAAQVRSILENLEIFVFADVNPDGKAYSQTIDLAGGQPQNYWWRKNRRTGLPGGAEGVDINRNFDFLWSSGIGTESDPTQFTYKGPGAFSEPETRNVRSLLDQHEHIAYYVDVHSFSELILYSWGDDQNQDTDPDQNFLNPEYDGVRGEVDDTDYREFMPTADQATLVGLAQSMHAALNAVRGKNYTVDQAVGLYPTSATSDDYVLSRHRVDSTRRKIHAFTLEFGQQFVPPYTEMRRIMADVASALTELCRRAGEA
jgi:carboxypeptidase T